MMVKIQVHTNSCLLPTWLQYRYSKMQWDSVNLKFVVYGAKYFEAIVLKIQTDDLHDRRSLNWNFYDFTPHGHNTPRA